MNPVLRNILAVVAGVIAGSIVNMGIIIVSTYIIPWPAGIDPMDPESIAEGMHLFETKHYIMPWLAHAIGTLVGAFTTAKLAANRKLILAMVIGIVFLVGGIQMVMSTPSPMTFTLLDLGLAYIPMAYLGAMFAGAKRKNT